MIEHGTPDPRPREWAIQAFHFWEQKGMGQSLLAKKVGLSERSLRRWASGERNPEPNNIAKTFFHLYAGGCFNDLEQAVDLAWLVGLTAQGIQDLLSETLAVNAGLTGFFEWLSPATDRKRADEAVPYLPDLPTYHVPTELAGRVEEALVAPREYRVPLHQVVVLHGGMAAGKTTTAASVLRDPQLQRFFRDGILFIPLGTEEDRKQALWRACQQAGLEAERDTPQAELQDRFQQWAGEASRLALLVLDDPPNADCLIPLLRIGPQVRVLITCQDRYAVARACQEY